MPTVGGSPAGGPWARLRRGGERGDGEAKIRTATTGVPWVAMAGEHREVRLPYPDAPVGTCRVCGDPCRPGLRSHVDCRRRFRDLRDYRTATLRDNGEVCHGCGTTDGPFHADHITPLWAGGSKEAWNRQPLCVPCHDTKTKREATARAAARRGEAPVADDKGSKRPADDGSQGWRYVAGGTLIGVAVSHLTGHPRYGTALLAAVLVGTVAYLLVRRRARKRAEIATALRHSVAVATGMSKTAPRLLRIRKWEGGQPVAFEVNYDPAVFRDDDDREVERLVRAVSKRLDRDGIAYVVKRSLSRVIFSPGEHVALADEEPREDADREKMIERLDVAIRAFVKTGDPRLKITDWDAQGPTALTVAYPPTFRDDLAEQRAGLQGVVNAKAGVGRWRLTWDTSRDLCTAERRPPMPTFIPHDAGDDLDPWRIPFCTSEDGDTLVWDLKKKPHMLVSGETGMGKTVLIRGVATECARRGFDVRGCDPKRIELNGLRSWPNVSRIETGTEEMCDLVADTWEEMDERYQGIEAGRLKVDDLRPILLIVDEAREWIDRANVWWKANKARLKREEGVEGGSEHPAVEQWRSITRLGRSARVFILVGIQRPDASILGGEARKNYGARVACGQMDEHSAKMMFDDSSIGRDLPEDAKGRATVDVGYGVHEAQVWWTPDPLTPGENSPLSEQADRLLLAALRPATVEAASGPVLTDPEPEAEEPVGEWETTRADGLFVTQRVRVRGQEGVLLGSKTIGRDEDRLVLDLRGVGPVEVDADEPVEVWTLARVRA